MKKVISGVWLRSGYTRLEGDIIPAEESSICVSAEGSFSAVTRILMYATYLYHKQIFLAEPIAVCWHICPAPCCRAGCFPSLSLSLITPQ